MEDTEIRNLAYKYQSVLKINFLPDVFMNAIGTDINHDTVLEEIKTRLDKTIIELKGLQTTIEN